MPIFGGTALEGSKLGEPQKYVKIFYKIFSYISFQQRLNTQLLKALSDLLSCGSWADKNKSALI